MAVVDGGAVDSAFSLLMEELGKFQSALNRSLAELAQEGDYERVASLAERAKKVQILIGNAQSLMHDWRSSTSSPARSQAESPVIRHTGKRQTFGRLPNGSRTQREAFYAPILNILIEHNGSLDKTGIIQTLETRMTNKLRSVDLQSTATAPK